jgi:hypothetical protein
VGARVVVASQTIKLIEIFVNLHFVFFFLHGNQQTLAEHIWFLEFVIILTTTAKG